LPFDLRAIAYRFELYDKVEVFSLAAGGSHSGLLFHAYQVGGGALPVQELPLTVLRLNGRIFSDSA
jgi:hypothetical protein